MIKLPNNCTASNPIVNPSNYKSGGKRLLLKPWFIQYRFKDPAFADEYPDGKFIVVKGMNKFKTLAERRQATDAILENEIYMLTVEGFNPITKTFNGSDLNNDNGVIIDEHSLFVESVEYAVENLEIAKKTADDLNRVMAFFTDAIRFEGFHVLKIKDVRKRNIVAIMDRVAKEKNYSPNRFNKMRSYVIMTFKKLVDIDAIDINPALAIPKKKTVKKLREILTDEELKEIKSHLKANYYTFYRFVSIFYYSGARTSELLLVQKKDVNLKDQVFKVTVIKGKDRREDLRAINKNALSLWAELCAETDSPNDYLFAKNLNPGKVAIDPWQISKRWREHVKNKLGINKDFYSLKHLHTVKVIEAYSADLSASINGHKSNAMNDKHYDVLKKQRILDAAKSIDVDF
ncbi:Phage integrase family protein [Maribacter dokdonensis]|uniref:Phage integrase family protein n=1 Tax=Maribacter dokdonensis TaxID=320912 RepID=A0ABY0TZ61_9FLAO|nr:tyrosine-type recombinase/integrase [Maribacter dokdonensis]SDR74631.1 Phage integrase family protein [Maribacter dokdonensis]SDT47723.1 Phage integrase family protein [Maribacter dokdonensis]